MFRKIAASIGSLFGSRREERELDEELAFHIDRETEENVRRGMPPEEAHRAALVRFGGVAKTKDETREASHAVWLDTTLQDVRYGLRSLRRNPGYAAAAILTLALGIGANTAIFSVVHGVLLQSLPYGGGDRLVRLRVDAAGAGINDGQFSPPEMRDLKERTHSFSDVVEYHSMWFVLLGKQEPERVQTGVVSASFFDLLGVHPILGRTFLPGEDQHGAEPVLVLSHDYWMRAFGGDPAVVGRVFQMNDRPHTVVGVLPPIPGYPQDNDVWMPISACPFRSDPAMENDRDGGMLRAFARLKPGSTLEDAHRDLTEVAGKLEADYPKSYPKTVRLALSPVALSEELTRTARPTFLMLFGTVGLVLLLACANVANLMLARLTRRHQELALRSALGAGRGRLARQLLTESVLLALAGGALGLVVAAAGQRMLVHFAERFTPRAAEIGLSVPVLLFSLGVSLVVGIGLGLIPALSPRRSLTASLQEGRERTTAGAGRLRARNLLIVTQVAISFVLLAGAGLMLRTLWKLSQVDPGFRTERVLTSRLDLNFSRYKEEDEQRAFHASLLERLKAEPGVLSVALAGSFPLNERGPSNGRFRMEGKPPVAPEALPRADFQRVSPDYFKTIGVPILKGRSLEAADRKDAPLVAVVNKSMAAPFLAGRGPDRPAHRRGRSRTGRDPLGHGRRRDGRRAPVRPRQSSRRAGLLLAPPVSRPLDDVPAAHGRGSLAHGAPRARGRARDRARAARGPLPHARRGPRGRPRRAAADGDPAGRLRRARADHHRHGHRGRHRVLGRPAPARVRHPHGPRRAALERAAHGAGAGNAARAGGARARPGRRDRPDADLGEPALRGVADGSADLLRRGVRSGRGRGGVVLRAGPPGDDRGSDGGAAWVVAGRGGPP